MLLYGIVLLLISHISLIQNSAVEWKDNNFQANLESKRVAFVMFFAPWCGHCKNLKPIWDQLASKKSISESAAIVKVDCTEGGKSLCQKYGVQGYPTLKFFKFEDKKEQVLDYTGGRTFVDLEAYVMENTRPSYEAVPDDKLKSFIESESVPVVVGFFKNDKSALYKEFISSSHLYLRDYKFGYTFSEDAARVMNQKQESVVIFRQPHFLTKLDDDFVSTDSATALDGLLTDNILNKVDIRTKRNEAKFTKPLVVVFTSLDHQMSKSSFRQFRNKIMKIAKKFMEVSFAISSSKEYEHFIQEFSSESKPEALYIVGYDKDDKKFVYNETVTLKDLKSFEEKLPLFVSNFLAGGVYEAHIKSEAIPVSNDEPVKVVVAKNFDEVVFDKEKDVLLEIYAPWCGHCKKLEPIYKQLAELLKNEKKLVIAKMDGTLNEHHPAYPVSGFPTVYFAKAGEKSKPISFNGERTLKGMVEWLKSQASFPIEFNGEIPETKEEL